MTAQGHLLCSYSPKNTALFSYSPKDTALFSYSPKDTALFSARPRTLLYFARPRTLHYVFIRPRTLHCFYSPKDSALFLFAHGHCIIMFTLKDTACLDLPAQESRLILLSAHGHCLYSSLRPIKSPFFCPLKDTGSFTLFSLKNFFLRFPLTNIVCLFPYVRSKGLSFLSAQEHCPILLSALRHYLSHFPHP